MMSRTNLLNRLMPATIVALVTFGVLGGALGAANAGGAGMPTSVQVTQPKYGDQGGYDLQTSGPWNESAFHASPARFLDFQWLNGEPERMGDEAVHATDKVVLSGSYYDSSKLLDFNFDGKSDANPWVPFHGGIIIEQGASKVLAYDTNRSTAELKGGGMAGTGISVGGGPVGPLESQVFSHAKSRYRQFDDYGPGCLFVNAAQGRSMHVGDSLYLNVGCSIGGVFSLWPVTYKAAAFESINGVAALRFDGNTPQMNLETLGSDLKPRDTVSYTASIWFADGISVPLQLGIRAQHEFATLTLATFTAGTQTRLAPAAASDPLPALAISKRPDWGVDDTGLVMDLLPSTAWNQAMTDPSYTKLRDFTKSHPGWYTESAYSFRLQGPAWWFHVTDGQTTFSVIVEVARDSGLPAPLPQHAFRYTDFPETQATSAGKREMFASGPTLAALQGRWRDYATRQDGAHAATNFLVRLGCADDGSGTCIPYEIALAGWEETSASPQRLDTTTTPPTLVRDESVRFSNLVLIDGKANWMQEHEENSTVRDGVFTLAPSSSGVPGHPVAGSGLSAWLPSPAQAAGAGLLALLAGLAYYLWPALKSGGALGLFSRLRTPELLNHPQRARLAGLVEANPGIHFQELLRQSGLPNGTLVHHLDVLRKGELLVAHRNGGYTCYFLAGATQRGAEAVKADGARRLLQAIQGSPGISGLELSRATGLTVSTVHHHVQRLLEGGVVTGQRDGRSIRLYARSPSAVEVAAA